MVAHEQELKSRFQDLRSRNKVFIEKITSKLFIIIFVLIFIVIVDLYNYMM